MARDPRSRIISDPGNTTIEDLLAVLLSSGSRHSSVFDMSRAVVQKAGDLEGLYKMTTEALMSLPGIGRSRAAIIQAALELGRRRLLEKPRKPGMFHPRQEAEWLHNHLGDQITEEFMLLTYNRRLNRIARHSLARGGPSAVQIYVRELIRFALNDRATYLLIAHNHPEQSAIASDADMETLTYLDEMVTDLGLEILDQYIVGDEGVYACREKHFLIWNQHP